MSSKSRRKSDLHTTTPKVKFIHHDKQTNIQLPSHPLTPSQLSFPLRVSRIFSECLGVWEFFIFGFFRILRSFSQVFSSSDVAQNVSPMLRPHRSLHGKCWVWGAEWLPGPEFIDIYIYTYLYICTNIYMCVCIIYIYIYLLKI